MPDVPGDRPATARRPHTRTRTRTRTEDHPNPAPQPSTHNRHRPTPRVRSSPSPSPTLLPASLSPADSNRRPVSGTGRGGGLPVRYGAGPVFRPGEGDRGAARAKTCKAPWLVGLRPARGVNRDHGRRRGTGDAVGAGGCRRTGPGRRIGSGGFGRTGWWRAGSVERGCGAWRGSVCVRGEGLSGAAGAAGVDPAATGRSQRTEERDPCGALTGRPDCRAPRGKRHNPAPAALAGRRPGEPVPVQEHGTAPAPAEGGGGRGPGETKRGVGGGYPGQWLAARAVVCAHCSRVT